MKKLISSLICIVFILDSLVWAVPPSVNPVRAESRLLTIDNPLSNKIHIPEKYGRIESTWSRQLDMGYVEEKPLVFLVKDAHCVYEAQRNIERILDILINDYKVDLVCVEGASGLVDPSILAVSTDMERREEVADKYLKKGYLTASEVLAMEKGENYGFSIWGVEDHKLYLKDLKAFRDTYSGSPVAVRFIEISKEVIRNLKNRFYSQDVLGFDEKIELYRENEFSLSELVPYLFREDEEGFLSYSNLRLTLKAISLESAIDFSEVEKERASLIKSIEGKYPKEDVEELVRNSLLYKMGKISSPEYYGYLKRFIPLEDCRKYSNLYRYIKTVKLQSKINADDLFNELDDLIESIYRSYINKKIAWDLHRIDEYIYLLGKLLRLEVTRGELIKYRESNLKISNIAEFLLIQGRANSISVPYEITDKSFLGEVEVYYEKPEEFYEYAIQRDNVLIENLISKMNDSGKESAALIIGGFHARGAERILREKDIQVVTITPTITKEDLQAKKIYLSRMFDERIQPDKMLTESRPKTLSQPIITAQVWESEYKPILEAIKDETLMEKVRRALVERAEIELTEEQIGKLRSRIETMKSGDPDASAIWILEQLVEKGSKKVAEAVPEKAPEAEKPGTPPEGSASIMALAETFPYEDQFGYLRPYETKVAPFIEEHGVLIGGVILRAMNRITPGEFGGGVSLAIDSLKKLDVQGLFYLLGYRTLPIISFALLLFLPVSWTLIVAMLFMNVLPMYAFISAHEEGKFLPITISLAMVLLGAGLSWGAIFLSPVFLLISLVAPVSISYIHYIGNMAWKIYQERKAEREEAFSWVDEDAWDRRGREREKRIGEVVGVIRENLGFLGGDIEKFLGQYGENIKVLSVILDLAEAGILNKDNFPAAVRLIKEDRDRNAAGIMGILSRMQEDEQYKELMELRLSDDESLSLQREKDIELRARAVIDNNINTIMCRSFRLFKQKTEGLTARAKDEIGDKRKRILEYLLFANKLLKAEAEEEGFTINDLAGKVFGLSTEGRERVREIVRKMGFVIGRDGEILFPYNMVTAGYRGSREATSDLYAHYVALDLGVMDQYANAYLNEVDDPMLHLLNDPENDNVRYPRVPDKKEIYAFAYTRTSENASEQDMLANRVIMPEFARKRSIHVRAFIPRNNEYKQMIWGQLKERKYENKLLDCLNRIVDEELDSRKKDRLKEDMLEAVNGLREECGLTPLYWSVNYGYLEDETFLSELMNVEGNSQQKREDVQNLLRNRYQANCADIYIKIKECLAIENLEDMIQQEYKERLGNWAMVYDNIYERIKDYLPERIRSLKNLKGIDYLSWLLTGTYVERVAEDEEGVSNPDEVKKEHQLVYLIKVLGDLKSQIDEENLGLNLLGLLEFKRDLREESGLEQVTWDDVDEFTQSVLEIDANLVKGKVIDITEKLQARINEREIAKKREEWEENPGRETLEDAIESIKDVTESDDIYIDSDLLSEFEPQKRWFDEDNILHGADHVTRVLALAEFLMNSVYKGRVDENIKNAVRWACITHDIGVLLMGGEDEEHGGRSADLLGEGGRWSSIGEKIGSQLLPIVQKLNTYHSVRDSAASGETEEIKLALEILKRADSLDRIGMNEGRPNYNINPDYEKFRDDPASDSLHKIARYLYEISNSLEVDAKLDKYEAVVGTGKILNIIGKELLSGEGLEDLIVGVSGVAMKPIGQAMDEGVRLELEERRLEFNGLAEKEGKNPEDYKSDKGFKVELGKIDFSALVAEADLGDIAAYSFIGEDGSLIVVLNSNVSSAIQEEGLFHEIRENYWINQGFSESEAHIIASYEQVAVFSVGGELTTYHNDQLEQMFRGMSFERLMFIMREDRSKHHEILERAIGKGAGAKKDMIYAYEEKLKEKTKELLMEKLISGLAKEFGIEEKDLREMFKPGQEEETIELFNTLYNLITKDGKIEAEEVEVIVESAEKVDGLFSKAEAQGIVFSKGVKDVKERISIYVAIREIEREKKESMAPEAYNSLKNELESRGVDDALIDEILMLKPFFIDADGNIKRSIFYELYIKQASRAFGLDRGIFSDFENYHWILSRIEGKVGVTVKESIEKDNIPKLVEYYFEKGMKDSIAVIMARYVMEGDSLIGARAETKEKMDKLFRIKRLNQLLEQEKPTMPIVDSVPFGVGSVSSGGKRAQALGQHLAKVDTTEPYKQSLSDALKGSKSGEAVIHNRYGISPAVIDGDGIISELDIVPVGTDDANVEAKKALKDSGKGLFLVDQEHKESISSLNDSSVVYKTDETFENLLPESLKRDALINESQESVFLQDTSLYIGTPDQVKMLAKGKYEIRDIGAGGIGFVRAIQRSKHHQYFLYQTEEQKDATKHYLSMYGIIAGDEQFIKLKEGESYQDVKAKSLKRKADLRGKAFIGMVHSTLSGRLQAEKGDRVLVGNEEGADLVLMSRMAMILASVRDAVSLKDPIKELLMYYYNDTDVYSPSEIEGLVSEWINRITETGIWEIILPRMTPFIKTYYDNLKIARGVIRKAA